MLTLSHPLITLDSFASLGLADHLSALRANRGRLSELRQQLATTTDFAQGDALSSEIGRLSTLSKLHLARVHELRQRPAMRATKALLDGFSLLNAA